MTNLHLRRLIISAVFLAISLIFRASTTLYLPLFGANDVRVGIHGIFTIMPAILFGPWYGAVVSGLADVLGFIIRPSGGAWLWQLTVIMATGGFIRGWVWRLLRSRSPVGMRGAVIAMTIVFVFFGCFSIVQLRQEGITRRLYNYVEEPSAVQTYDMNSISRFVIRRSQNTSRPSDFLSSQIVSITVAPLGAGILGIILLGVDFVLSKKLKNEQSEGLSMKDVTGAGGTAPTNGDSKWQKNLKRLTGPWNGSIMPLAMTVIIVSLLINFTNSLVMWAFTAPAWGAFPFTYIWLPRALVALLNSVVNVFVGVLLLRVCYRLPNLRSIIEK